MTVTCTICNKTEPTQEQFERFHIPTHEHVRMMSAYEKGIEAGEYKQATRIDELTTHNAAMQEDAVNNTVTIKMLMAQLAEQVEENRGLRQMLHMEPR